MSELREVKYGPYIFRLKHGDDVSGERVDKFIRVLSGNSDICNKVSQNGFNFNINISCLSHISDDISEYDVLDLPMKHRLFIKNDGDILKIKMRDFHCEFEKSEKSVKLEVQSDADIYYCLEDCMRVLVSRQIVIDGGLMVHSACAGFNDGAIVFPGGENSGKTTLAGLMGDGLKVLSDERCAIFRDGEDYYVCGAGVRGNTGGFKLRGIFFHQKDTQNWLSPININTSVKNLLRETFCFTNESEVLEKGLENAISISRDIPAFKLGFTRSSCIEDFLKDVVRYGM